MIVGLALCGHLTASGDFWWNMKSRIKLGFELKLDGSLHPALFYYDEHGNLVQVVSGKAREVVWEATEGDAYSKRSNL